MRVLVLATMLSMIVACGKSRAVVDPPARDAPEHPPAPLGPGTSRGPLQTEADALRAFEAAFSEEVRPALLTWHPSYAQYRPGRFDRVARVACRDAAKEQENRREMSRFFGDHETIGRDGDCWVLYQDNWGAPHPYAVLDAQTGSLLYGSFAPCG